MQFRSHIYLRNWFFANPNLPTPSGWTHIVLNYIGPNNGQGIRIYEDGVLTGSDDMKSSRAIASGNGRVVVGRIYTNYDAQHGGIDADELLFFNQALGDQQVLDIKNID